MRAPPKTLQPFLSANKVLPGGAGAALGLCCRPQPKFGVLPPFPPCLWSKGSASVNPTSTPRLSNFTFFTACPIPGRSDPLAQAPNSQEKICNPNRDTGWTWINVNRRQATLETETMKRTRTSADLFPPTLSAFRSQHPVFRLSCTLSALFGRRLIRGWRAPR